MLQKCVSHPIWAMAFRPFYLCAAIYGAWAILLWAGGYTGNATLPVQYWHAHEMIWGYTGAVVVGFLLTAVATWTGQPPVRGQSLMILLILWLTARITAHFSASVLVSGVVGTLFYGLAAWLLAMSVWRSRNTRNYVVVLALAMLAVSHALFHWHLRPFNPLALHNGLVAGLVLISGFIGLIGNRIIPFFTAKRLNTAQVATPIWAMLAALILPLFMAILLLFQAALPVVGVLGIAAGLLGLVQSWRWFHRAVLAESMLWILHLGYVFASVGLAILGVAQFWGGYGKMASLGIHLIAVGGIGLLTLGMMTRTALGHTARPLYPAPRGLNVAFYCMVGAAVLRAVAAMLMNVNAIGYVHAYRTSAVLFAVALLIYVWRFALWLMQPRLDGKV